MKTTELLSHIDLFREMTSQDLSNLASRTEQIHFHRNKVIFNAGDEGNDLYMIKSGRVEIYIPQKKKDQNIVLAVLPAGRFFGELSLFDKKPRSATARAIEPSEILVLKQKELLSYINSRPQAAVAMLAEISERLRRTNELLSQRQSRNVYDEIDKKTKLSDKIADKVASFGGSWKFILSFLGFILVWMVLNVVQIFVQPFDHYPYQFLNLVLAVIASLQAPFIMMSQNRQATKDRLSSQVDYEVNLKNEMGIEQALRKLDVLTQTLIGPDRIAAKKKPARGPRG
jgi:CRP/FNR family cyclic AMP-dependent transcriptional regulator